MSRRHVGSIAIAYLLAACAGGPRPAQGPTPRVRTAPTPSPADVTGTSGKRAEPEPAPAEAFLAGLMPLTSTGIDRFQTEHPTYDGRGVLIGILDSGIDPGVDGLIVTSTGAPKILDLRDFSAEGRVALTPVAPSGDGDTVRVAGRPLTGARRIARLATGATWYAGVLRELPLGPAPAADLNGDGKNTDVFQVVVVKATDGWVAFLDSNLNGSFEDEQPLHDYREGRQTIALGTKPLTLAANFSEDHGVPVLDLYFDTLGHGTHVAGIAAGHNLYNVGGFDGVAPGAQILGLKIANNARGGISVHGSMQRAMEYAARFAAERNLPLVLNMSFGVGNEFEGQAVIDSIVDGFLRAHPDVVMTIAAGNDGPALSTMGFPASADLALSVGALVPGTFLRKPDPRRPPAPDVVAWFSARGAETTKPDLVVPGFAYSTVPRWNTGDEVKFGTSMAAPYAAGLAARLISALAQEGRPLAAADVRQALRVSATPVRGGGGGGVRPSWMTVSASRRSSGPTVGCVRTARGPHTWSAPAGPRRQPSDATVSLARVTPSRCSALPTLGDCAPRSSRCRATPPGSPRRRRSRPARSVPISASPTTPPRSLVPGCTRERLSGGTPTTRWPGPYSSS